MGQQILDGEGSGRRAGVDKGFRLKTKAITEPEIEEASEEGQAYLWATDLINIDSDDTVLLVKNTSDTNLHIEAVLISNGSTASEFTIHVITAVDATVTGVTVTGFNLNTGSANVADASAASDETGYSAQGTVVTTLFLLAETNQTILTPGLILAKNKAIAVDVVDTTTEVACTIVGHYEAE